MSTPESSQSIDTAAAEWVARRDRGDLTQGEEASFQEWLQGDMRRPGALLRAQAVFLRSEAAIGLGAGYSPADFLDAPDIPAASAPPRTSRRQFLKAGGIAAALGAVGLGLGLGLGTTRAYATERGERRLVRLDDGSTMFLNTSTQVEVRYDQDTRAVQLIQGEAFFTVADDHKRPFVVEAGQGRLSTDGASFRVRMLEDAPANVLVDYGKVAVAAAQDGGSVVLPAHTGLVLSPAGAMQSRPVRLSAEDILRDLAWRDGKIAFQGETLAQAAASFARYGDPHIEIRDPQLGEEPVTGLFAANDPLGFSQAIATLFGARLSRHGETIVLARSVS